MHQLAAIRENLPGPDRKGFDLAMSLHVGRVGHAPPPAPLGPSAAAGYYATVGMQGAGPDMKSGMMATLASNPTVRVGAVAGIQRVVSRREGWWVKVKRSLGFGADGAKSAWTSRV
jgi:hypothetical protein